MKENLKKNTLIVNLLSGPGAGKSTLAAAVFSELKFYGANCELAAEYAKDLAWEERHKTFENQIYIFGKQHHRITRLVGQVDVIITDSPLLLTPIYDAEKRLELKKLALNEHKKNPSYNVFVQRRKKFNPKGRLHDEKQSIELDNKILDFLKRNRIPYQTLEGTRESVQHIVRVVFEQLGWSNTF